MLALLAAGPLFSHTANVYMNICESLHEAAPGYLHDYCIDTHSSASGLRPRSTDKRDLHVIRLKTLFGDRAFSAAGPCYWNSLSSVMCAADSELPMLSILS